MLAGVDRQWLGITLIPKLRRPRILVHHLPWLLIEPIRRSAFWSQWFMLIIRCRPVIVEVTLGRILFWVGKVFRPDILGLLVEDIRLHLPTTVTKVIGHYLFVFGLRSQKRHLDSWVLKLWRLWPTRSGWSL